MDKWYGVLKKCAMKKGAVLLLIVIIF